MKNKNFIIAILILLPHLVLCQSRIRVITTPYISQYPSQSSVPQYPSRKNSCEDLMDFVVESGNKKATLQSYILSSSWLNKVTAYSYDSKVYVFAEIKRDEFSIKTQTYIFCGIPNINWQNFQLGGLGDSDSYGERFHKYIIDYQCNCD